MTKLSFGKKLMLLRKEKELTQLELAKILGIGANNIARYETNRFPSVDILLKIASFFNVSLDYLLKENGINIQDKNLLSLFEKMDQLDPKDRNVLKGTISGTLESYLNNKGV